MGILKNTMGFHLSNSDISENGGFNQQVWIYPGDISPKWLSNHQNMGISSHHRD